MAHHFEGPITPSCGRERNCITIVTTTDKPSTTDRMSFVDTSSQLMHFANNPNMH